MEKRPVSSRVRVLLSTQLLDTAPEHAFDRLTRLAAGLLAVPVALVSLVDDHRQFFKSALGLPEPWASRRETPLSHSFCQYVARDRVALVVNDAREHPDLKDNKAIQDLHVIAYAGVPLVVANEAIGALCVIDDKSRHWSEEELRLLRDLAESVVSEIELRMALRAVQEQRRLNDTLLESLGDAVVAVDKEGTYLIVNEAARRIFDEDTVKGGVLSADWPARYRSVRPGGSPIAPGDGALGRALQGKSTDGLEFSLQRTGASQGVWVEASGRPVRDAAGQVVAAIAVYRDISERKQEAEDLRRTHEQLEREQALFEATLEHIEDGVQLLDSRRQILLANRAYSEMFALPLCQVKGLTHEQFTAQVAALVDEPKKLAEQLAWGAEGEPTELVLARPQRRILRQAWSEVPLPTGDGLLVTWRDVTAEKDLLAERERLLLVDVLTGIPNRRAAEWALHAEDVRRKRGGTPLSVALFDVDHFKRVNDAFGHATGDEVLRQVAAKLAACARATDTVARWGGEEFLAVLPVTREGALAFCERVRLAIEKLQCPPVGRVTISVGVAEIGPHESPEAAISRADACLYEAKRAGRNRVQI